MVTGRDERAAIWGDGGLEGSCRPAVWETRPGFVIRSILNQEPAALDLSGLRGSAPKVSCRVGWKTKAG